MIHYHGLPITPNATGDLSSAEFVEQLRDGWNDFVEQLLDDLEV